MDTPMIHMSDVELAYKEQLEHTSYIRALTDDFSFLDKLIDNGGNNNDQ